MTPDVIVVGGGIVGVTTALELARRGASVTLLEKGPIASEQSGRNWGFIRRQGRDPAEIGLAARANERYAALEDELGEPVGWVRGGNLRVAPDEAKLAQYRSWFEEVDAGRTLGTRLVTGVEIRELVPGMRQEWLGGMHTPLDGHADPDQVTKAIGRAAERAGARIETGVTVTDLETVGDRVTGVRAREGVRPAGVVIVATGIWTPRLVRPVGIPLPIRWVRGTVALTAPLPPVTELAVWTPDVAFRQRRDGRVVLGTSGASDFDLTLEALRDVRAFLPNYLANWRLFRFHLGWMFFDDLRRRLPLLRHGAIPFDWPRASDPPPNPAKVSRSRAAFASLFPDLPKPLVERSWPGYIDATPDGLPAIGPAEAVDGLYLAAGFSGHGFGLGPAVGEAMAELVTTGRSTVDLTALRPGRFAERGMRVRARAVT